MNLNSGITRLRSDAFRRGFAFTEVLFAVMVLGIGFIMIAAMFPITIRQTQNTMQDTQGANTAKGALAYLQSIASNANFPVTSGGSPKVFSLTDCPPSGGVRPGYLEARGNFIDPNNPRIAWVPLYRRGVNADGTPESFAQVFIFVMQSYNRPEYTAKPQPLGGNKYWTDLSPEPSLGFPTSTLEPTPIQVTLKYNPVTSSGEMTFPDFATLPSAPTAPGAYVVIAEDGAAGRSNGRVYQLGNPIDEQKQIWALAPGGDMTVSTPPASSDDNDLTTSTRAYIIGRGYSDMTQNFNINNPSTAFSGPSQGIAVYSGFIQVSR